MFNNGSNNFGGLLLSQKHNNLRVISTPEFPVPYYQRIMRNLPAVEDVSMRIDTILEPPSDSTVIRVKGNLAKSSDGLKVLDYIENKAKINNYITYVPSVTKQCNIYSDDLIHYLDSAHEENCRILKSVDLSDCLK
jgi:hypothetical protein